MFFFQSFTDLQEESEPDESKAKQQKVSSDKWVDEHGDYLYGLAVQRVGDPRAAEDIVQDTFMAGLKALDSFQGRSTERTWLVSILKHKIIDFYRKNKRFVYFDQDGDPEESAAFYHSGRLKGTWKPEFAPKEWFENPVDALEKKEFQDILQKCIRNLPKNLAAVFTIREMDGWSTEDICKELNISQSNLWVMLHRSRMQLRRCLEKNWFSG